MTQYVTTLPNIRRTQEDSRVDMPNKISVFGGCSALGFQEGNPKLLVESQVRAAACNRQHQIDPVVERWAKRVGNQD